MRNLFRSVFLASALCTGVACPTHNLSAQAIVADHASVGQFTEIPQSVLDQIRSSYSFYYAHTSHGSQLVTGMNMLAAENAAYAKPSFYEVSDDLGADGDTTWEPPLRSHLNAHPEITAVMLSWCGGVSDNTVAGIDAYLYAMTDLEQDYPNITFVYMTGHLDGTGDAGNLNMRNNQIRGYCIANEKILFDFADIETYDPDGTRYPNATDACEWCYDWCVGHACPACTDCAHSHCFNCYQKGKAFWWMMARVSGWTAEAQLHCEGRIGNANGLGTYPNEVTISDIQTLITAKFIAGTCNGIIACVAEADVNQSGGANPTCNDITISDVQTLVNHLFIAGPLNAPLKLCL